METAMKKAVTAKKREALPRSCAVTGKSETIALLMNSEANANKREKRERKWKIGGR